MAAWFALPRPAAASTYLFSIPESTIQNAIVNLLASHSVDAAQYTFYEIYIRPAVGNEFSATNLSSYTISNSGSPIPANSNGDQWDSAFGAGIAAPGDSSHPSVHYYFHNSDTRLAMLSSNSHVAGQTYTNPYGSNSMLGENMPGADLFKLTISSNDPNLSKPVNLWVGGVAMQINTSSGAYAGGKGTFISVAEVTISGSEVPETGTILMLVGGLLILASASLRRHRKASK